VPHTVEEAYELADAAERDDPAKLRDELGDVLFQVHFLSLLLEERGEGDLAAVADGCTEKLIRRHPHVFTEAEAGSSAEVLRNWDRIKRESEGLDEVFADVPENLPGLLQARKLQRRAASAGAEDLDAPASLERVASELEAISARARAGETGGPTADAEVRQALEHAIGDLLFAAVGAARKLRVDPELALRSASARFRDRIAQR
jgi:MazG family protein